jgi:hypothetical protein
MSAYGAGLDSLSGRPLDDLLKEHAHALETLKNELGATEPCEDDIMLLRFLLQGGGDAALASQRAKEGRDLRIQYKDVIEKALRNEHLPQEPKIRPFLCHEWWRYPSTEDELRYPPMMMTRSGFSNGQKLMEVVSEQELVEYFIWERRRCFEEVVQKSQQTGQLIMMISLNDLEGASLITGREPKFFQAVKVSSEAGSCLCPLLTRKHVMVNAGLIIDALFRIASVFMPQRALDKVAFMKCTEFLEASGIPPEKFPDFLGGTCRLPRESPLASGEPAGIVDI